MDVRRTIDNVAGLMRRVEALTSLEVLVGVPADKTGRREGPITNASLAYIHEFGSPASNIPARPFLRPGVRNAREDIAARMKQGATDVMEGRDTASKTLNAVGLIARNSVVKAITDPEPPFAPLKPETIRRRLRKTQAGRRKLRQIMEGGKQIGMSSPDILTSYAQARWDTGGAGLNVPPLIDSGQLRASITYVIRPATNPRLTWWGIQRDYGRIITR
jgi:hypothetical protein